MTTTLLASPSRLSNPELLAEVKRLAAREREATVILIAHLAELDARRLYLAEGCSSLFAYATQVLHLSEHAAYGRIEAARAARRYPLVLERLADGSVTLTTVALLAPHLTPETHRDLLDQAQHRSKREVEALARKKWAATERPRRSRGTAPGSRDIPAEVKRVVWRRDGGRCAFLSPAGRRCTERSFLEFHHVVPYALGGQATPENIQLRCRAHNGYEADKDFGPRPPWRVGEPASPYGLPRRGARSTTTRSGPSAARATASAPAGP